MPKVGAIRTDFSSGEFSPLLYGRSDYDGYGRAGRQCSNFTTLRQGPARFRSGTRFVHETKDSSKESRLLKFKYSTEQQYAIELGDEYLRLYRDKGILVSAPDTPVEIATPWDDTEIWQVKVVQSADVLYMLHPDYQPRKLSRSGVDTTPGNWSLALVGYEDGPYEPVNTTATTLTPDDVTGNVTITASAVTGINGGAGFLSTDVGRLIRIQTGRRKIKNMLPRNGGAQTYLLLGFHTFTAGDSITVTGTTDYNGTHTIAGVDSSGVRISVAFTYDQSDARNELQTVVQDHTAGEFTITFLGEETGDLDFNDSLANIKAALEGLSTIGAGNVTVAGTDGNNFTVKFIGALANTDVDLLVMNDGTTPLSGGSTVLADAVTETFRGNDGQTARVSGVGVGGESSWSWLTITAVNSTTEVEADVEGDDDLNAAAATDIWRLGLWSDTTGWPAVAGIHQQRMYFGQTSERPQTVAASVVGDFERHTPSSLEDGSVRDDDGFVRTIDDNQVNAIQWIVSDNQGIVFATDSGPFLGISTANFDPITPTNFSIARQNDFGAHATAAVQYVRGKILLVHQTGTKLGQQAFVFADDKYIEQELSIRADHLAAAGIIDTAYQQEPDSMLWCVLADGRLAAMTYEPQERIIAWHQHTLGGVFGSGAAVVESIESIRDGADDLLYMIVKRTVDGSTLRTVEYLQPPLAYGGAQADAYHVDCGLSYEGAPTGSVSGLDHLEGQSVMVVGDGISQGEKTVASGAVAVSPAASTVHVGLGYSGELETMDLLFNGLDVRGRVQSPLTVFAVLHQALGGLIGEASRDGNLLDALVPGAVMVQDEIRAVPIATALENSARIRIEHTDPYPMTVVAMMVPAHVGDYQ